MMKGVTKVNNMYRARIFFEGKQHHLGYFYTEEDAYIEYLAAKELIQEGKFAPPKYEPREKTSKYPGVHLNFDTYMWVAQLRHKGKVYYLGAYDYEEWAHEAIEINKFEIKKGRRILTPEETYLCVLVTNSE